MPPVPNTRVNAAVADASNGSGVKANIIVITVIVSNISTEVILLSITIRVPILIILCVPMISVSSSGCSHVIRCVCIISLIRISIVRRVRIALLSRITNIILVRPTRRYSSTSVRLSVHITRIPRVIRMFIRVPIRST